MAKLGVSVEVTEEGTKQNDYSNLPDGVYLLQVTEAPVKEKDENTSKHAISVSTLIKVIEPEELEGRGFYVNYNVKNPSQQAQDIGNRDFQKLLRALDLSSLPDDDTDNLLFIPFYAKIGMGRDSKEKNADGTPKYPARNEIKRYYFPDEDNAPEVGVTASAAPVAARPAAASAAPAQAARPAGAKPWGRKA